MRDPLTDKIIGAAIEVHRSLGPGLWESIYETCLFYELKQRGLEVERQKHVPLKYKSVNLDCGLRIDLLVENQVVVELKTVQCFEPVHEAQLLSYLKLTGCRTSLLINFHIAILRDGILRRVL